ncbi:MAG: HlyD family efflux transporter periplasmic adaptor subunit [Planctomycetes bacterium]|nr:HlyD family efflux transporter periplasmic adaptor subunit [Planctomycetota bacterium]
MPDFTRTTRALGRQSTTRSWWLPLALAALLVGWSAWAFLAELTVYAVTDTARLEVDQAAYPIEAPVDGRIVATHIVLGSHVASGDPLLELDSEPFRLERAELVARREGFVRELEPLRAQIRARGEQVENLRQARSTGGDELTAELQQQEAALRLAETVMRRAESLHADGLTAEIDLEKAKTDLEQCRANVERCRAAIERLDWDRRAQANELAAVLEETRHDEALALREISVADAAIQRLDHQIERRTIRAAVAGRLGEIENVRVGQYVAQGTRLGAVVPSGTLRIVAEFRPEEALGRVHTGQNARFRLRGFPWIEYGSIPARVTGFASEVLSGNARVELSVADDVEFPIVLQHGLPGRLEIAIERVSPATLVLRASGAWLAGSKDEAVDP